MNQDRSSGGIAALQQSEVDDLSAQLESREAAARRHGLWAVLGVSPAALVPLIATASDFGVTALVAGSILVTGVEAWRALRARASAARIRTDLDATRRRVESGGDPRP